MQLREGPEVERRQPAWLHDGQKGEKRRHPDEGREVPHERPAKDGDPRPCRRGDERQRQVHEHPAFQPDGRQDVSSCTGNRCQQPRERSVVENKSVQGQTCHRNQRESRSGECNGCGL
ncbi:hypothetical protein D9M70_601270 [compost metagenome]